MSKAKKSSSAASVKIAKDLKETRLNPVEGKGKISCTNVVRNLLRIDR
jgi:hypothetical protein